jgi:tight adherence protein C
VVPLIAVCTFGSIILLVIGLCMRSERSIIRERMFAQPRPHEGTLNSVEIEMAVPFTERIALPFLRRLAGFATRFTPGGAAQVVEEKLETAGRPWNMGFKEFMGLKVLSVLVAALSGIAAVNFFNAAPMLRAIGLIVIVFCGIALPDYLLENTIRKRQSGVRRVLADTLDLMTVCVEAGLGLDGAMQKVVEKLDSPFSKEILRALQEMRLGKMRTDALKDMAKRIRIPEVSSFVSALCQADQLGVSIGKVLRVQCDTLRNVRSQKAREAAAKLPVKLLIPLVFFIFPAIFVVVIAPGGIQIARSFGMLQ